MPQYAAFLRGVVPMNCSMPELKKSFEAAGFSDVRTLLSSGNVHGLEKSQAGPKRRCTGYGARRRGRDGPRGAGTA